MQVTLSPLSLSAQTAYAQLLESALSAEHVRSVSDLSGSFAAKMVKGKKYWYYQYTEPSGKLHQLYVGPEGPAVQRLMQRKAQPGAARSLEPLARSAIQLGCASLLPRHFRVIRRLADYGFFRAGGVLIGTHAFLTFANMLGVRWGSESRTQDIDFTHAGKALALLLPGNVEVQTGAAIDSLSMGSLPISGLSGKTGGAYLIPTEPEFRLDFLTPLHRGGDAPYEHPQLHVTLQPLPFMEYLLQEVGQAVVFCEEGAALVNVPAVERFALHKLLVYGERAGSFQIKSNKDLAQAAHLLAYLGEHRPEAVRAAADDLCARGKGWLAPFRQGVQALTKVYPGVGVSAVLAAAVGMPTPVGHAPPKKKKPA